MVTLGPSYTYNNKIWRPSLTKSDSNSFFHSTFGTRTNTDGEYMDKHAQFRRKNWETFLTYFQNDKIRPHLAVTLKERFSANDEYQGKFKENLAKYVSDIADQAVTIKDILILASLESIRIIIFSDTPNSPIVISPKDEILLGYPNGPARPKEEVVLLLRGGVFSRMDHEPVPESFPGLDQNDVESDKIDFPKSGNAGINGIRYQIALLVIFLLNALLKLKKWKLSTENENAGKFDDVVIEWPNNAVLLQSKFKESKKITLEYLFSTNPDSADFSLPKYFLFYQKVKAKFNVKNVILCTNASVDEEIKKYLTRQNMCSKSMLHYDSGSCQFYTFNENILPGLKKESGNYYRKNCQGKGIDESVITDDNLKDFLKHLQFYCNYPSVEDTEEVIDKLLSRNKLQGKIAPWEIITKVMDWFQQKEGVCLTYLHAKAKFSEIWRDRYYQTLESYNVLFQNNDWRLPNFKQISHIVTEAGYLLQVLKIYHALQNDKKKILYVSPSDCINVQKEVVDVFGQLHYLFLVIIWSNVTEESVIKTICRQFKDILKRRKNKKIILVAEENVLSRQSVLETDDYVVVTEFVTFQELEKGTQSRLLSQKSIVFQGEGVSLNELFAPKKAEEFTEALNLETLEKLVKQEEIKVGYRTLHLDEHISKYYIVRSLKRGESGTGRAFSQDTIYGLEEKVVLIRSCSGMGKTTLLAKLAIDLKEKHPHLWVIKMEVKDYAGILNKWTTGQRKIEVMELFLSCGDTNKLNHLEKCVFALDGKVVVLLDSIDEVNSKLMTDLLVQCQNSRNFFKIFVTAKSHASPELEGNLKLKSLVLQPFAEADQVEFLARYWACNLNLDKEKCEQSAKALIEQISWTNSNSDRRDHFAAVPFHAKIVAEHFQQWNDLKNRKGCVRYFNGDTKSESNQIYTFLTKLFDVLIERKREDYVNRLDPNGNPEVSKTFTEQFNKCLDCHHNVALEMILGRGKCNLFPCYRQGTEEIQRHALNLGFLQKSEGKFHFVCGKLADYFFAKNVIEELKRNEKGEIRKFFEEEILVKPEFKVTLGFLNCLRQSEDISKLINQMEAIL